MKTCKYFLMLALLLVNLVIAPPSFADRPKFTKNPDYVALTKEMERLQTVKKTQSQLEGYTPEQIDQAIDELTLEKYVFESGVDWGQCTNETGKTIGVYGPEPGLDDDEYSEGSALYFLANGQTTEDRWNCKGIYLPNDVKVTALSQDGQTQEVAGGVAIKIPIGANLVLRANPDTGVLEFNQAGTKIVKSGDVNWFIPNVSQAIVDARVTNAPTNKA
ncbi:hypothetical protein H6G33_20160 [Calothrix sp. FACHB-1219]|uniref:hypothetical protein n=1 Tax=unclassified Calothrix TaxID=2619626 RepID=UPI0016870C51|nr:MULTISPECIES: hypothetical protein [unclassified Calothrix]MBD2204540.1 hypothetical protein [Calothrix sp. FACHB-168]MBD2219338.1 hypothetical protein [Calothrix sp. FACHB-1219]